MIISRLSYRGIGMTSQRTRERLVKRLREAGIRNASVLDVMLNTPRHIFVDEALSSRAYDDTALPIGHGQTISQPYMVARMTELVIESGPANKILEIGTGSGYQAAVLAQLVEQVYTIERISALLSRARRRLRELRLYNVHLKHYDGNMGWSQNAPFDVIVVTAAPREVPTALLEQLDMDGRMIIPVGGSTNQELVMITRTPQGYQKEVVERVKFVPLMSGNY